MDAPTTDEEFAKVIKGLTKDKAPGLDAFTAKLFKCYAKEVISVT